jgi:hypothetical protein
MSSHLSSDAELRAERQTERLTLIAMGLGDPQTETRKLAEQACEILWPHELDTLAAARKTMALLMLKLAVWHVTGKS